MSQGDTLAVAAKDGVTLRIYTRHVTPLEEKKIISNAANKNRMSQSNTNDLQQTVMAESNLQDVATIVAQAHRNREPFIHSAVYIELSAHDLDQLKLLQIEVMTERTSTSEPMTRPTPTFASSATVGSGKSFSTKREITNVFLITTDDIIVCDPEAEVQQEVA